MAVLACSQTRGGRAARAIAGAAEADDDALVRQVARAAVERRGRDVRSRKALERRLLAVEPETAPLLGNGR